MPATRSAPLSTTAWRFSRRMISGSPLRLHPQPRLALGIFRPHRRAEQHARQPRDATAILHMVGTDGVNGAYKRDSTTSARVSDLPGIRCPRPSSAAATGFITTTFPQDLMIANFTNDAGLVDASDRPQGRCNSLQLQFRPPLMAQPRGPVFTAGAHALPGSDIFFTPA